MGVVYILTNPAMPGLIKIGKSERDDYRLRVQELSRSSAAPLPFEIHFAGEVENPGFVEQTLHRLFNAERQNPHREFFWMQPERAVIAMSLAQPRDVTPRPEQYLDSESQEELVAVERRRPPFRFSMANIPVGSELAFSRNQDIKAKVLDDLCVEFQGERMRLTPAAVRAFASIGVTVVRVQGPAYWTFDGQLLTEIRDRLEGGGEE